MSIFILKIIATLTMVIDHIRYVVPELDNDLSKLLGRISFIIFAFILSEGIWHTKDRIKYLNRVVLFAAVSQVPYMLFKTAISGAPITLNIMFTLSVAMIFIILIDRQKENYIKLILGIIAVFIGIIIPLDYGAYGITLVLVMYYGRKTFYFDVGVLIVTCIYYMGKITEAKGRIELLIPYMIGNIIGYILIKFYNGKLGKKIKFLYWFYPVHLLIIYFLYLYLNDVSLISIK